MKEFFEHRRLSGTIKIALKDDEGNIIRTWEADKKSLSNHIVEIVEDYRQQGYRLTLRQLYYQLVTKNYIPNHDTAYKKISSLKDDLCYSGKLDWDLIEDRGRVPYLPYAVDGVDDAIKDTIDAYRLDRQKTQDVCVELWTEKDAISGILKRVTQKYHVKLCVNKGYTSSSAIYTAYNRFAEKIKAGQKVIILYFGDHDPSGLDMVRDIEDRLMGMLTRGKAIPSDTANDYCREKGYDAGDLTLSHKHIRISNSTDRDDDGWDDAIDAYQSEQKRLYVKEESLFTVKHIGLTMPQIKQFNLPPNPAKITDPRANEYIKKHGKISWEVDALPPARLVSIVEENIQEEIDIDKYNDVLKEEQKDIKKLKAIIKK